MHNFQCRLQLSIIWEVKGAIQVMAIDRVTLVSANRSRIYLQLLYRCAQVTQSAFSPVLLQESNAWFFALSSLWPESRASLTLLVLVAYIGYELFLESNASWTQVVLGFYLNNSVLILSTLTVTEKPLSYQRQFSVMLLCFLMFFQWYPLLG